jgi:prepilin-type N-terminal cleavage/methylation domain-containing protein
MRGFSMLEMCIVMAITLITAAITIMAFRPALKDAQVNTAYSTALSQLRGARERAITERKRYYVQFIAPQTIQLWRWDIGVPVSPAPVLVSTNTLPTPDIQFQTLAGLPSTAATVPDGFGTGAVAIDFDQGVGAGQLNYVMFMPDGSSQDMNGNINSGIVYLARTGDLYTSKAITVMGATGRIRGWRLVQKGSATWVQQ